MKINAPDNCQLPISKSLYIISTTHTVNTVTHTNTHIDAHTLSQENTRAFWTTWKSDDEHMNTFYTQKIISKKIYINRNSCFDLNLFAIYFCIKIIASKYFVVFAKYRFRKIFTRCQLLQMQRKHWNLYCNSSHAFDICIALTSKRRTNRMKNIRERPQ